MYVSKHFQQLLARFSQSPAEILDQLPLIDSPTGATGSPGKPRTRRLVISMGQTLR